MVEHPHKVYIPRILRLRSTNVTPLSISVTWTGLFIRGNSRLLSFVSQQRHPAGGNDPLSCVEIRLHINQNKPLNFNLSQGFHIYV